MQLRHALTALLVVGMLVPAAAPAVSQTNRSAASTPTPAAQTTATAVGAGSAQDGGSADGNYTRLYVDDEYRHLRLKPGHNDTVTITVENGEDRGVVLTPHVVVPKLRERPVEKDWISIQSDDLTLKAGEERTFKVSIAIPEGVELGNYQGWIAFTNETIQYPGQPPRPVHAASINVEVWKEPTVKIRSGKYMYSQIQAGETYTHTIVIENQGDSPVPVNPQIDTERRRYSGSDQSVGRSWFAIEAPNEIAPNTTATVNVTVAVPADADRGHYDAELDLGLKDPARPEHDDYWQQIDLNFQVWSQPEEPFTTGFEVAEDTTAITVTLSAAEHRAGSGDPASFNVSFVAPDGSVLDAERVRTTNRGYVDLGENDRRERATDSPYATDGEDRSFRYRVEAPEEGTWTLRVMPHNTMQFSYEIVRNESG